MEVDGEVIHGIVLQDLKQQNKTKPLNLKGYTKGDAAVPTRMLRKICSLQDL